MLKINILIVDDDLLAMKRLSDSLTQNEDFEIVNHAKDGVEAIELIEKYKPDVVLLDIIMPKLDGLGVLEYFKNVGEGVRPVFIVFSSVNNETYITRVMNLGASYYIIKPFDENIIAVRIRQLYHDTEKDRKKQNGYPVSKPRSKHKVIHKDDELRRLATKYMHEIGLKANMTGYFYIREIITAAFDYYCKTGKLPKGIYEKIALKNNVSVSKVERAIRNCIEKRAAIDEEKLTNFEVICKLMYNIRVNC